LIPTRQPAGWQPKQPKPRKPPKGGPQRGRFLTQHTGLPPRTTR
jgi:hypothetical protein